MGFICPLNILLITFFVEAVSFFVINDDTKMFVSMTAYTIAFSPFFSNGLYLCVNLIKSHV